MRENVNSYPRMLRATWTLSLEDDLKVLYDDLFKKLSSALSKKEFIEEEEFKV